jgi:hypothetical protein
VFFETKVMHAFLTLMRTSDVTTLIDFATEFSKVLISLPQDSPVRLQGDFFQDVTDFLRLVMVHTADANEIADLAKIVASILTPVSRSRFGKALRLFPGGQALIASIDTESMFRKDVQVTNNSCPPFIDYILVLAGI